MGASFEKSPCCAHWRYSSQDQNCNPKPCEETLSEEKLVCSSRLRAFLGRTGFIRCSRRGRWGPGALGRRADWGGPVGHIFLFSHCGYFMLFHMICDGGHPITSQLWGCQQFCFAPHWENASTIRPRTRNRARAVFAWFTLREVRQLLQAVGGLRLTHHHWLRRYTKWLHPLDTTYR